MYARRTVSVIAAALSVGVCAFITYISRDVDLNTLLFNLGFLAVMLLMILVSCFAGLRRLMQISRSLARAADTVSAGHFSEEYASDAHPLFKNRFLDDCYQQYRRMIQNHPESSTDIQNFINEEAIESHVHRGILELVPDILTSLGILGTFVGLVMGLREFDPSGYEQMAGSVTPLINGIKVAFITSIYGISLSLAFSYNLRSEFANLNAKLEAFFDSYYLNVRPPYEVDSLAKLVSQHKSQEELTQELTGLFVEQMGKSFEQAITPAFARMTDGINRIVTSFTQNQEQVMAQVCDHVLGQMRQELTDDFTQISQTVAELEKSHESYADFMDRSIVRLQQTFVSMQEHMQQTERYNSDALGKLTAAQQEAYRISQEQKATYQEYIRFMYESIERFSAVWEKNSEKMKAYSDEIASLGPVQYSRDTKDALANISAQLQDLQKRQLTAEMNAEMNLDTNTADLLKKTLRKLDDLEDAVSSPRLFRRRK